MHFLKIPLQVEFYKFKLSLWKKLSVEKAAICFEMANLMADAKQTVNIEQKIRSNV
jgi:hypothetical protein